MAKPTKLPQWATDASRTVEPSAAEKGTGWVVSTKPPARKMNWLFNIIYTWLLWIDARLVEGATALDLIVQGEDAGAGTDLDGGDLTISAGQSTGDGGAEIDFKIVEASQGAGATTRNPAAVGKISKTTKRLEMDYGVDGSTVTGIGVHGDATGAGDGVKGTSSTGNGVHGVTTNSIGVFGEDAGNGDGVKGSSSSGYGVHATSVSGNAIYAETSGLTCILGYDSGAGDGVKGQSATGIGVFGFSTGGRGLVAQGDTSTPGYPAFRIVPQNAEPSGTKLAGDIYVLTNGGKPNIYNGSSYDRIVTQSYAAGSDSDTITNSVTEDTFSQKYTVPANTLRQGSSVRIRGYCFVNSITGSPTLTLKLKIGSQTLFTVTDAPVAASDFFTFDAYVLVDSSGGSIKAIGTLLPLLPGQGATYSDINRTGSITLSASNDVQLTAQWSAASASNQVSLEMLVVDVL